MVITRVADPALLKRRGLRQSAFFQGVGVELLVATDSGGKPVARCAAIDNPRWRNSPRELGVGFDTRKAAFIGYFAAAPGHLTEVRQMLRAAERWLKRRGVWRVIAPCNGNALVGMGLLTAGFTESPMFPMPWNPRYYVDYFERSDYAPRYPIWTYEIDFSSPEYRRFKRVLSSPRCHVRPISKPSDKRAWRADIDTLRTLFNRSFRGEWELQEFTQAEFQEWADPLLPENYVLFASIPNRRGPVGFAVGFPDWTPQFRASRGAPPPRADLRRAANKPQRAGVIGGALLRSLKGQQFSPTVAAEFFRRMEEEYNLPGALYHFINHANAASRGLGAAAGGRGRILYHCYDKIIRPW